MVKFELIKQTIIDIYNYYNGAYWLGRFEDKFPICMSWDKNTAVFDYKMRYNTYNMKHVRIEMDIAGEYIWFQMDGVITKEFNFDDVTTMYDILMKKKPVLESLQIMIA
jgi:hypothetical protein